MVSNYRKSPGRFGEIGNEVGIQRPPVRPSIAFPNARNVLRHLDVLGGTESATPSIGKSDSTPTTALYFSTTDVDDMSSLGEDPSILEIRFPANPVEVACDAVQPAVTNSQTTSQTMTTLMDLFHPTESTPTQKLHSNTPNSEPPSEEAKKKKKKKKKRSDDDDKKTKVGSDKNKSKGEKSKTKKSKSKEDAQNTTGEKNESLDRKKKKSSPSEPLTGSPNEPTRKAKKKPRKSDESSPEAKRPVDKTSEKKQKKPSKGEAVVPAPTCQESKSKGSKSSKGKCTNREKSSSQNDNSPDFSRATKDIMGNKTYKTKSTYDEFKSKPLCTNTKSKNLLPTKHSTNNRSTTTTDISPATDTQHHTLEFAIASIPKERATERNPKVTKKSKGPFIKRIFGENHSRQLAAF